MFESKKKGEGVKENEVGREVSEVSLGTLNSIWYVSKAGIT